MSCAKLEKFQITEILTAQRGLSFKGRTELFYVYTVHFGGTRWRSCLRYCATSRKVASSIPDSVTGIFH
jgi:hypothetical protein